MALTPWGLRSSELSDHLDGEAPAAVRVIDVENGIGVIRLSPSRSGESYRRLLALLRCNGEPLGWIALPVSSDGEVSLEPLADSFDGVPQPRSSETGSPGVDVKSLLSVVVTTCADTEMLLRCVEAIRACGDESLEIVVVENRPVLSTVQRALEDRYGGDERVRYLEEYRRGLSRARNAGLNAAQGELVAFTDDDILVDRAWLRTIRTAFERAPSVDCVTGLILPSELETQSQILVERFASFGKGFTRRTYTLADPPLDQPLFPYTAGYFGSGANMAFRTEALHRLGGFDPALGTGTRARGGEDLDICIRLLHAGGQLAYEPGVIVWHRHPDMPARLRQQVFGYGVGLGAMLSKQIVTGPDRWSIVSRALEGARYFTHPESRKNAARGPLFPRDLTRLERIGMIYGPLAYLTSRLERVR